MARYTNADAVALLDNLGAQGTRVLADMKEWIADADFPEFVEEREAVEDLTETEIICGVARHFEGGIPAFLRTCDYLEVSA
jgi:hypothetical protein